MSAKGRIARAAGLMSVATLISRILGYVKDMILARYFGATGMADVFFVAFRIPNLLRELFAEGSMSSAFVPVLTEYQTKDGKEEANRLVRATFIFILVFVGIICALGIIFAPTIVTAIAPGFLKDPEKFSNTVLLTRIMFPFLLFISLAALTMGALNTRGIFFVPALAPALLNIVTIISVLTLSMRFTNPIISVAIGVTAGGLVQFLFQVPAFFRQGYNLRFQISNLKSRIRHPGLKKIGMLIIPATAGMAVAQINIFVSTILASYLAEGSITYLYYSMRLIQFPIGIFGVAMGMAVLPALSEHSVRGEMEKVKEDFSFALRLLFFITVPAMIGLIALKTPIVSTLFQRGEFGYAATIGTSDALMFYSFGIWAVVGARVITATFYSMQDTKTPVKVAAAAMIINIIMSLLLMGPMKHSGLAFANAIASICNFIVLFYFLRKKLGGVGTRKIARSFAKTLLASAVMGIAGWFVIGSGLWAKSGHDMEKALYLGAAITVCGGIYMLFACLLKSEEMGYIIDKARQKMWRKDAD
ncbi:MAG: murein biosynthesis integral membrane protein MurJ [Nitrospirae bacterium]|nr:murein biosynthesis integral membrane protein MurJ [Nitrospirota bacterium]MCL5978438.1 murein biosynthesis integral membrane protein MurJ [Nitrospirota bacterium]